MEYEWSSTEDGALPGETVWTYVFTVDEERLPTGVFASLERAEEWIASNWCSSWRDGMLIRYVLDSPISMSGIPPFFLYTNGQRNPRS